MNAHEEFSRGHIENGVFRWNSNDRVAPDDILQSFEAAGLITNEVLNRSLEVRKEEDAAAIAEYIARRQRVGYSDEEMFEMRAAFGEGAEVVDIFTGETIRV